MPVNKMLIEAYLKKLKMPQAAKNYESLAREAGDNNLDYEEYLLCVLEQEVHQRENNRIQRGIRQAGFPVIKTLESFDFLAIPSLNKPRVLKLMQGEYIRRRENVLLIGNSGVGKTHIATALGYEACRQGMRVKFYTAAGLINELLAAQQEYRLNKLEKQWLAPHLVILDELGDEQMTAALLDRLTHNAHILNINGESYRFKQALSKQVDVG